jgi:hypothetical protein
MTPDAFLEHREAPRDVGGIWMGWGWDLHHA